MTLRRMTREESRDQTRSRLLAAASRLIAKKGLAASSVEDIAAEAGFSRGAFYSNFEDKAALLLALLVRDHRRLTDEVAEVFDARTAPEDFEKAVLSYYMTAYLDGDCFLSSMEARLLAMRDPVFRARMRDALAESHAIVANFVTTFRQRMGLASTLPATQLALGLMSLCDGLQFAHMADPQTVTGEMVEAVLSHYFAMTIAMSGPET